ncbi:hypothetical protein [Acetobacter sp. DsW_063]|uniref:hypothetical protein n=1 Tax=Acetobacter sp. DsW_063 TaxID=1514894 RepID=UPI000A3BBA75|nr:hypothetical protein [Acetobacter sp. DsW_063]OUJ14281.1 hypothetical protein HK28_14250 [Acetobacter sp. DsW_063]
MRLPRPTHKFTAAILLTLGGASLAGCQMTPEQIDYACMQQKPDDLLLREPTLEHFIQGCGLDYYTDVTGRIKLHYTPPRGDGTLPVVAASSFAVSEPGGSHGRVWYFCMPVPISVADSQPSASPTATRTNQAVCRYAGSGEKRLNLIYDQDDATKYDPIKW